MIAINNTHIYLILFALIIIGCEGSRYHMVDDFGIQLNETATAWEFYSQLECNDNPKALNVKSVQWNSNVIMIENENKLNKNEFYIIYSPKEQLKSCNVINLIIGPIESSGVETFILKNKITFLNVKHFQ